MMRLGGMMILLSYGLLDGRYGFFQSLLLATLSTPHALEYLAPFILARI